MFSFKPGELVNRTEEEAKKKPRRVRALSVNPVSAEQAGSDEGLPALSLPNLVCIENLYRYKKCQ